MTIEPSREGHMCVYLKSRDRVAREKVMGRILMLHFLIASGMIEKKSNANAN